MRRALESFFFIIRPLGKRVIRFCLAGRRVNRSRAHFHPPPGGDVIVLKTDGEAAWPSVSGSPASVVAQGDRYLVYTLSASLTVETDVPLRAEDFEVNQIPNAPDNASGRSTWPGAGPRPRRGKPAATGRSIGAAS